MRPRLKTSIAALAVLLVAFACVYQLFLRYSYVTATIDYGSGKHESTTFRIDHLTHTQCTMPCR
jgi:hypothetical protein